MENPLVTVFIPIYNSERFLKETLESIIDQTYRNIEILIVNDGSTDNSVNIVKSYSDKRIKLINNTENKGIPYTRNKGILEAKGKYLAVMDSDDIAYPNRIERQLKFMEKNQSIDAVGSNYKVFNENYNKLNISEYNTSEDIKIGLMFFNRICNSSVLLRLETIKKHSLSYNLKYFVAQDYDMFIQISKVGNIYILPDVLIKYRTGHFNITKKSKVDKIVERKEIIDSIHKDILTYYDFNYTKEELAAFNEFFSNEVRDRISTKSLDLISTVLLKMIQYNKQSQLFNEKKLIQIISKSVLAILKTSKLSMLRKIKLYNQFCKNKSFIYTSKEIGYICIKHFYNKVERRAK